ncbi:hypothetical protein [Chromobacterium vaccinii]|uniref:Uncharacterized protein n=1 Tax=Chromobacterium vaccinii TaxID=1108595 RepID=A0A1D9LGZ1_9NEIS|nr:hypothetical protein [Chromobacterium vaccinii]AOZ50518.1 hypothetical protein BKX93_11330 [Chromobacterium vaccinii]
MPYNQLLIESMTVTPPHLLSFADEDASADVSCHLLADAFPPIVHLAEELEPYITSGISLWREAYGLEPGDNYSAEVLQAAQWLRHGLPSALDYSDEYGVFQSLAHAIRWAVPELTQARSSDGQLYALASAWIAYDAIRELAHWLDTSLALLQQDFQPGQHIGDAEIDVWLEDDPATFRVFVHEGRQATLTEWALQFPDAFTAWVEPYRLKWALHEAEQREWAARSLGTVGRLGALAQVADSLTQAELDKQSLTIVTRRTRDAQKKAASAAIKYHAEEKAAWLSLAHILRQENRNLSYSDLARRIIKTRQLSESAARSIRLHLSAYLVK